MSGFYVPFQSFLPLAIVGGALFAAGPLLLTTHRFFNNGKVKFKKLKEEEEFLCFFSRLGFVWIRGIG